MERKEFDLKYRIICFECNKPFDSRTADNINGYSICPECMRKKVYRINSNNGYGTLDINKEKGKQYE